MVILDIVHAGVETLLNEGVAAGVSSPVLSLRIAEQGKKRQVRVLDAPVSGGDISDLSKSVTGPVIRAEGGISACSGVGSSGLRPGRRAPSCS